MAWEADHIKGITPHPVPLPMGEGTLLRAPCSVQAFPLPWGEGQGEGVQASRLAGPRNVSHLRELRGDNYSFRREV